MLLEAPPPAGDRVGVALQFGPHLQVGGFVGLGATQNESGPEGEPLGRRTGLDEGVEVLGFVHRQTKAGGFPGHGGPSRKKCGRGGTTPEKGIATGGTSPDAPMYTKVQVKPMNLQNSRLVGGDDVSPTAVIGLIPQRVAVRQAPPRLFPRFPI